MYENLEIEDVKNDMLERLASDIDTREGSFFNDMISTVAYEIWKYYRMLDAILPIAYVDETSGKYIDIRCADYGIARKQGKRAETKLKIEGTEGTEVQKGKVFLTSEGLEFELSETVTIVGSFVTVAATAKEIGEEYNVKEGMITRQFTNLKGITKITNTEAKGGVNKETDLMLVNRFYDYLKAPSTSGNKNHYKEWAMKVPGVGDSKVFPLWNGNGTVKVVIVDSNKQPAEENLILETAKYIEENRPIGAKITVASGSRKTIDITATLELAGGYTVQEVTNFFIVDMKEYLKSIVFTLPYVSHAKVGTILMGTEGIIDYSNLKINETISNVILKEEEIPILGKVDMGVQDAV